MTFPHTRIYNEYDNTMVYKLVISDIQSVVIKHSSNIHDELIEMIDRRQFATLSGRKSINSSTVTVHIHHIVQYYE